MLAVPTPWVHISNVTPIAQSYLEQKTENDKLLRVQVSLDRNETGMSYKRLVSSGVTQNH